MVKKDAALKNYTKKDLWSGEFNGEYVPTETVVKSKNGLSGLFDVNGNTIIPYKYNSIEPLYAGVSIVSRKNEGKLEYALVNGKDELVFGWTKNRIQREGESYIMIEEVLNKYSTKDNLFENGYSFSAFQGKLLEYASEESWIATSLIAFVSKARRNRGSGIFLTTAEYKRLSVTEREKLEEEQEQKNKKNREEAKAEIETMRNNYVNELKSVGYEVIERQ